MVKLNRFQKQGERAFKIYNALGPGPFTVMQVEKVLGLHRIGPTIGSLREDGIVVHHDGSQMPMVRKIGETRKSPLWRFTTKVIKTFERWKREPQEADIRTPVVCGVCGHTWATKRTTDTVPCPACRAPVMRTYESSQGVTVCE